MDASWNFQVRFFALRAINVNGHCRARWTNSNTTNPQDESGRSANATSNNQDRVRDGRIDKKWKGDRKLCRPRGFANQKADCYKNSLLQCLFHLPEFNCYLSGIHQICDRGRNKCVVCPLQALQEKVQTAWEDKKCNLNKPLRSLNDAMRRNVPKDHDMEDDLKRGNQSDPYDFLKYLKEELEKVEGPQDEFKLNDLFAIEQERHWKCSECEKVSNSPLPAEQAGHGIGLSVDIQQPETGLSLVEYLRRDYVESLPIRCESASCIANFGAKFEGQERTRHTFITKAPEVLVVKLNRYTQTENEKGKVDFAKITEAVKFEEYLNMGEFTESEEPLMYQLQSVFAHHGDSLKSGHYIAAIRKVDGKDFCAINDESDPEYNRSGTVEELESPLSMGSNFDPYILIYSKI